RTVMPCVRFQQRVGDEMVPAETEQAGAGIDDFVSVFLDRRGYRLGPAEVEHAIAVVDDGEPVEWIERHTVRSSSGHDAGGGADRAGPDAGTRTVRGRRVERYAGDDEVDPVQVAGVFPPHERKSARVGRLAGRAVGTLPGEGMI